MVLLAANQLQGTSHYFMSEQSHKKTLERSVRALDEFSRVPYFIACEIMAS